MFNIEPNKNINANKFWYNIVLNLLKTGECFIIQEKNELFITDSANKSDDNSTVDIKVGEIEKTVELSTIIHLEFENNNIRQDFKNLQNMYFDILNNAISNYKKKNSFKFLLKMAGVQSNKNDEEFRETIAKKLSAFMNDTNSILPISDGYELVDKSQNGGKDIGDVLNIYKEYVFSVASRYHVPVGLLLGQMVATKEQMNNFLTFTIDPIVKLLEDEINRKYFGKNEYLKGSYLKIDSSKIKHIDILDSASGMDALYRIGFSHNDLRDILSLPKIKETWASNHYVTKNYMDIEGGEINAENK